MRMLLTLILFLALVTDVPWSRAADPSHPAPSVALVVQAQGTVRARDSAHASWRALTMGDELFAGQTVAVGKNGYLLLAWHRAGPRFQAVPGAVAAVTTGGLQRISGPAPALMPARGSRVFYNPTDMRRPREGVLAATSRGDNSNAGLRLLYPLGATAETRPSFQWTASPPAQKVRLYLYHGNSRNYSWTRQIQVKDQSVFPYPSDEPALIPGETYRWALKTIGEDSSRRIEVLFWTSTPGVNAGIDSLRAGAAAHPEDPVARISFIRALWDAGFFREAATAAESCAKTQPQNASLQQLTAHLKNRWDALAQGAADPQKMKWPSREQ